eukprot:PLAT302.4.p1 GENE.PLAT302.4~~PLAT302.4.p1  ORF type:complete len:247 (+),score=76.28 PLAT302.4:23-742(+)
MKRLIPQQCALTLQQRRAVAAADSAAQLHGILRRDFWVVTPCESMRVEGKVMEGTRLTIQAVSPVGHRFTIRTPGTPARWRAYSEELEVAWQAVGDAVRRSRRRADKEAEAEEGKDEAEEHDAALAAAVLRVFYYWVNFGPLTRGSAATGYAIMYALFYAAGLRVTQPPPSGMQLDWEAILQPSPEAFVEAVGHLLAPARERVDPEQLRTLPQVEQVVPTLRAALEMLNCGEMDAVEGR